MVLVGCAGAVEVVRQALVQALAKEATVAAGDAVGIDLRGVEDRVIILAVTAAELPPDAEFRVDGPLNRNEVTTEVQTSATTPPGIYEVVIRTVARLDREVRDDEHRVTVEVRAP